MVKKIIIILGIFAVLQVAPGYSQAAENVSFTVNSYIFLVDGQAGIMDAAPYIKNGRTYLPVRYVAQAAGIAGENIIWNPFDKSVTLIKGNRTVKLVVGSTTMFFNGLPVVMDAAPEIENGRTMLPLRYLAQSMDLIVSWDEASRTVTISSGSEPDKLRPKFENGTVPSLTYKDSVSTVPKYFKWQYNGTSYSFHVEVPTALLEWDREVKALSKKFYSTKNGYDQFLLLSSMPEDIKPLILSLTDKVNGNFIPWVNEEANYKFSGFLGERLAMQAADDGYDYFYTAEFVLSFVGGAIPYVVADLQLPAQSLVDNGDCDCKSVLLAAILKNMGYRVALLKYPAHEAVGIAFSDNQLPKGRKLSYYNDNGTKYYFCETTTAGWSIGQVSDKSLEETAFVYPVN